MDDRDDREHSPGGQQDPVEPVDQATDDERGGPGPDPAASVAATSATGSTSSAGSRPPTTEGVRIAAVEAAVAAGLAPSTGRRLDAPGASSAADSTESQFSPLELPDWSDPPTGQVPRILLGGNGEDGDDDGGAPMRGPTWREDRSDWDQDLDLSFLVGGDEPTGIAGRVSAGDSDDDPFDFSFDQLATPVTRRPEPAAGAHDPTVTSAGPSIAGGTGGLPGSPESATASLDDVDDAAWAQLLDPSVAVPTREIDRLGPRRGPRHGRGRGSSRRHSPAHGQRTVPRPGERAESEDPGAGGTPRGNKERSGSGGRSPLLATATGVVAGAVALGCFVAGAISSLVLVTLLVTLAAGEAFGAMRRSGRQPATVLGLLVVPGLVVGAYLHGPQAVPFVLGLGVLLGFCWYLVERLRSLDGRHQPVTDLGATLLVVGWVGLLGSFAGMMLAPATFPHRHGVAFLASTVLLTVAADVGAYAVGAKLGRHPLAPRISPHKSWEGFVGGTVLVLVVAVAVVARIHPFTLSRALMLAAIVIVLAPIGDLAESLVKRDLKVKDMGSLLPAHGGVLDRVDAMLFVLPVAYYVLRLVHPS